MWLNSHPDFSAHMNKRLEKVKIIESKIKGLSRTYRLSLALIDQIHILFIDDLAFLTAN